MTFKQLEQFLKTEKWRAGANLKTNACGIYARCTYCDNFADYPCARAFDALMKKRKEGKAPPSAWQHPEPDVQAKFGTLFASENEGEGFSRISINPEDLFYFNLGGKDAESYSQPYYEKETETAVVEAGCTSPIPTYTEETCIADELEISAPPLTFPEATKTVETDDAQSFAPASAYTERVDAETCETHAVTVFTQTAIVPEGAINRERVIARALNGRSGTRLLVIKRRAKS